MRDSIREEAILATQNVVEEPDETPEFELGDEIEREDEAPRKRRGKVFVPGGFLFRGNRTLFEALQRFEAHRNWNEVFRPGSQDTTDAIRGDIVARKDYSGLTGYDSMVRLLKEANTGVGVRCDCTARARKAAETGDHKTASYIGGMCVVQKHHAGWWNTPMAADFVIGHTHVMQFPGTPHEDVFDGEPGYRPLRAFVPTKPDEKDYPTKGGYEEALQEWGEDSEEKKRAVAELVEAIDLIEGIHDEKPALPLRNLSRVEQARTKREDPAVSYEEVPLARLKGANTYDTEALVTQNIRFEATTEILITKEGVSIRENVVVKGGGLLTLEDLDPIDCPRPLVWPKSIVEHLSGKFGPWEKEWVWTNGNWVWKDQVLDMDFLGFLLGKATDEIVEKTCRGEPRWPETEIGIPTSEALTLRARDLLLISPTETLPVPIEIRSPLRKTWARGIEKREYFCSQCGRATAHFRDVIKWKPTWFGKSGAWRCDHCGKVAKDQILTLKISFKVSGRPDAPLRTMVLSVWGAGFLQYWKNALEHQDKGMARLMNISWALDAKTRLVKPVRRGWQVIGDDEIA